MNDVVQGLWIGPELSALERLSIQSFLAQGHEYHLYVYEEVRNIPPGAIIKDAEAILASSRIFRYTNHDSVAGFSNFFRYKLLLERGGWWVDSDVVCLKQFDFSDDYVFSSERVGAADLPTSGIIKAPSGAEVIGYAWSVCEAADTRELEWGETGPALIAAAVRKFSLENCVMPAPVFCPLSFREWESVLDPDTRLEFGNMTVAVHLWNEMWRKAGRDKNAAYNAGCLFERLKSRFCAHSGRASNKA